MLYSCKKLARESFAWPEEYGAMWECGTGMAAGPDTVVAIFEITGMGAVGTEGGAM